MKREFKIEWHLSYSKEMIWNLLTNPEMLRKWLPNISDFQSIEGFEYEQNQKPRGNWDGIIYHKITKLIPFKQLSYTFQSGPKKGVITLDTLVTFILTPEENGTLLKLEHTGFEGAGNCFTSLILEMGWKNQIAKKFKKILSEK